MTSFGKLLAKLDRQMAEGHAHGIRLWWVSFGIAEPTRFDVAAFAITTDPTTGVASITPTLAANPTVSARYSLLVSAVQLDGLDAETLAAVVTLPRNRFYGVSIPGLPSDAPAPDAERVQTALAADIARDEPGSLQSIATAVPSRKGRR